MGRRFGVTDAIVHVGARIVGDDATKVSVDVDGVHEYTVVLSETFETLRRIAIIGALGYVYVHPNTVLDGQRCCSFEGFVAACKGGMYTDHSVRTRRKEAIAFVESTQGGAR
jgi:hypothetical protein